MNKRKEDHIENQMHLSESQLIRYSDGTMTDAEMHQVEMHLLSCDFCSEALEGIALIDAGAKKAAMTSLQSRFMKRMERDSHRPKVAYWRWAAIAAIFLLSSVVLLVLLNNNILPEKEIAREENDMMGDVPFVASKPLVELKEDSTTIEDNFLNQNAIALNERQHERESNRSKKVVRPETENSASPAPQAMEAEAPAAALFAPEEEVLESRAYMDTEAVVARKLDSTFSISMAENKALAGRTMGLKTEGMTNLKAGRQISGTVLDDAGEPIPGANIYIKGSGRGTVADINGEYTLRLPDSASTLIMNFISYISEEVNLKESDTNLTTTLSPDVMTLNEVVVTGYGVQQKRQVSGAVATVEAVEPPKLANGRRKFDKYLKENLVTDEALQSGVEGTLTISFYVEVDGTLSEFEVIASLGYGLEEKAVQLIENGPEWVPASRDDISVRERVILDIPVKIKKK